MIFDAVSIVNIYLLLKGLDGDISPFGTFIIYIFVWPPLQFAIWSEVGLHIQLI